MCRKTSQQGHRQAWLSRELCLELQKKRKSYVQSMEKEATQENYNNFARLHSVKIRRTKAQLELTLTTAIKDN